MIIILSVLQLQNSLADSSFILILQVIIATLGVILSFWVANYRGEMAATKYTLKEARRREHVLMLVDEPMHILESSLLVIDGILKVWYTHPGKLNTMRVDIYSDKSPETSFLFEHLSTGYPQLWQAICRFQDSYNKIVDQVLAIYQRALDLLEEKWGAITDLRTGVTSPKTYAAEAIDNFSKEVTNRLQWGKEPLKATVKTPDIITFWSTDIDSVPWADAETIVHDLNSILEDPEVFRQLQQLWEEAKLLRKEREQICSQLDRIKAFTRAGIFLRGSCTVGREANYE
jgi:hypothetical protein